MSDRTTGRAERTDYVAEHLLSRAGVLDNSLQPAKDHVFRFAVGTTF